MIEAKNLSYEIKNKKKKFCIKNVSLKLEPGAITCLLGHNGAGKTTLMELLYGAIKPSDGEILYFAESKSSEKLSDEAHADDRPLSGEAYADDRQLSDEARADDRPLSDESRAENPNNAIFRRNFSKCIGLAEYHARVAYVGMPWCIKTLSIRENVEFFSPLYPNFDENLFYEMMEKFGVSEELNQVYMALSKGQQVKSEIAFAIARNPEYIIMDEPLANLDPVVKTEIVNVFIELARNRGIGLCISTHLVEEVSDIVDYVALIENGELVEYGDRETVFEKHETTRLRDVVSRGPRELV
ncbi:MAG: ABC transporter ATP-binding protein [Lachnospiraceae bacterium]|nr:ABC transporter ATP-binding protein [Lachnospiraceae bacterium]